jgi:hypothetical protein
MTAVHQRVCKHSEAGRGKSDMWCALLGLHSVYCGGGGGVTCGECNLSLLNCMQP